MIPPKIDLHAIDKHKIRKKKIIASAAATTVVSVQHFISMGKGRKKGSKNVKRERKTV